MNVVATLTCAWCGREIDGFKGQLNKATGQLLLFPTPNRHLPRCAHCGGPLFVEDWEPLVAPPNPIDLRGRPGRPRRSAA